MPGLVHLLAHPAESAELTGSRKLRTLPVDLEILVAVVAHADPDCAVSKGGLEVSLPQIGRLEDVSVAVDHGGFNSHRPPPGPQGAMSVRSTLTVMPGRPRSLAPSSSGHRRYSDGDPPLRAEANRRLRELDLAHGAGDAGRAGVEAGLPQQAAVGAVAEKIGAHGGKPAIDHDHLPGDEA